MTFSKYLFLSSLFFLLIPFSVAQPLRVILDTDIDSDVDDVGALAMLHTLMDHNRVDLLAIIVTSDDRYAPACTDAINHYFGRPDIPIGVEKGIELKHFSRYTRQISEEFPSRIRDYDDAEDAVALYRRILADAPDSSVVIISIGHLTNVAALLLSKGDQYSDLSGKELAARKVKLWSCMGGMFPEGKEANFYRPDPASTSITLKHWSGKVVFAGWEVGNDVITGGAFLKKMLPGGSPVSRSYELYNNFSGRQSWDQVSVLYAISPDKAYWTLEDQGYCEVFEDGSNRWVNNGKKGNHAYLKEKLSPVEIAKIIDALMTGMYRDEF